MSSTTAPITVKKSSAAIGVKTRAAIGVKKTRTVSDPKKLKSLQRKAHKEESDRLRKAGLFNEPTPRELAQLSWPRKLDLVFHFLNARSTLRNMEAAAAKKKHDLAQAKQAAALSKSEPTDDVVDSDDDEQDECAHLMMGMLAESDF